MFFIDIVTLFLLIFAFPIPLLGNSIYIAIAISSFRILFSYEARYYFKSLLLSRYFLSIMVFYILLLTYSFFITTIIGAYDYSRLKVITSMMIGAFCVLIVYSSIQDNRDKPILNLLVYIFIIQSCIELIAFTVPSFAEFVRLFQFQNEAELAESSYNGIRGLAISGRLYFEFASAFGLILIIQMYRILQSDNIRYIYVLQYLVLFIGGFFAGRTVLVGVFFSLILFAIYPKVMTIKLNFIIKLIIIISLFLVFLIIILPPEVLLFAQERLLPWFFDLFIKYAETGTTETSHSFNTLNEMYEVKISVQEWIIGAGRYKNTDGSYFNSVDGGYIRQIFFWGIIGSFLNFILVLFYFISPIKSLFKIRAKGAIYFLLIIGIYMMVLHYKGEILGASRFCFVILLLCLFDVLRLSKLTLLKIKNDERYY